MSPSPNITKVRNLLIPTLPYPCVDRYGMNAANEMATRPQTVDRALEIIEHLHLLYTCFNNQPSGNTYTEYEIGDPYATTLPMTQAAESRVRAIWTALRKLSPDESATLFRFFSMLPPDDQVPWLQYNTKMYHRDEFAVAPQVWMIRAGVERLGELCSMVGRPGYKSIYDGLQRRDECWRQEEGTGQLEYNGMMWLGKEIERWGWGARIDLRL